MVENEINQEKDQEEEFSGIQYYAQIIAKTFTPSSDANDCDVQRSAEELLLKWCSTTPDPQDVNELVKHLKHLGFEPTALRRNNDFDMVYLLKNRV